MYMETRLKHIRIKNGLYQKEMAEKLGISRSHYAGIEKGKANVSYEVAYSIFRNFGISVEEALRPMGAAEVMQDLQKDIKKDCERGKLKQPRQVEI